MAKTVYCVGKVLPEKDAISIPYSRIKLAHESGLEYRAEIYIKRGEIFVKFELLAGDADMFTLKTIAEEGVRAIVDAHGFYHGGGYDVEISAGFDLDGAYSKPADRFHVFGVEVGELEREKEKRPFTPEQIIKLFEESGYLPHALADLREAIRSLNTGFFCFRAVELVRQHFYKPEDGQRKDPSWERLRNNLNLTKDWINQKIGDYADPQRHGAELFMYGKTRTDLMQNAWIVIDRFCSYLDGGSLPLDKAKWPIL